MSFNVGCYVDGCTNRVIGQCAGYKGGCGKFYCTTHSVESLCTSCAQRKQEDEEAQAIDTDYRQTAKKLRSDENRLYMVLQFILFALFWPGLCWMIQSDGNTTTMWVFFIGYPTLVLVFSLFMRKQYKAKLKEIDKIKPGFLEFYKLWTKEQNRKGCLVFHIIPRGW